MLHIWESNCHLEDALLAAFAEPRILVAEVVAVVKDLVFAWVSTFEGIEVFERSGVASFGRSRSVVETAEANELGLMTATD